MFQKTIMALCIEYALADIGITYRNRQRVAALSGKVSPCVS